MYLLSLKIFFLALETRHLAFLCLLHTTHLSQLAQVEFMQHPLVVLLVFGMHYSPGIHALVWSPFTLTLTLAVRFA